MSEQTKMSFDYRETDIPQDSQLSDEPVIIWEAEAAELHRMLKLNTALTPFTFLKSMGCGGEDEDENSESKALECSATSDDSGFGNEILPDDLENSLDELDLGIPPQPKTPVRSPFGRSPQTEFKTPGKSPGFLKTPNNPIVSSSTPKSSYARLSTPLQRALLNSPDSSPSRVPRINRPLFRGCFNRDVGVSYKSNVKTSTTEQPQQQQPKPMPFRMTLSGANRTLPKPKPVNVSQFVSVSVKKPPAEADKTDDDPKGEPGQQLLQKYFRCKKRCKEKTRIINTLSSKLHLKGDEDLPKKDYISDVVFNMVKTIQTTRPQIIVQDPMTKLEMEQFKEKVRATKRQCDCPCYCGGDGDDCGPSQAKRFFSSALPPLSDDYLNGFCSL